MDSTDIMSALKTALIASGLFADTESFPGSVAEQEQYISTNLPNCLIRFVGGDMVCVNRGSGRHLKTENFNLRIGVSADLSAGDAQIDAQTIEDGLRGAIAGQDLSLAILPFNFTGWKLEVIKNNIEYWQATCQTKYVVEAA